MNLTANFIGTLRSRFFSCKTGCLQQWKLLLPLSHAYEMTEVSNIYTWEWLAGIKKQQLKSAKENKNGNLWSDAVICTVV